MSPMSARLLRPTQSGFNPKSIGGLAAWYDAADSSTVTTATGASEWKDKSGNGRTLVQSVGLDQPTRTATINGKSALVFDGVNHYLSCMGGSFSNETFFIVARRDATSAANAAMFSYRASATNVSGNLSALTADSDSGFTLTFGIAAVENLGLNPAPSSSVIYYKNGSLVATGIISGIGGQSYSVAPYPNTTDVNVLTIFSGNTLAGAKNFAVGCDCFNSSRTYGMTLCEIIIFSKVLTATQRSAVERYLGKKWGVSIA
jgi:hypothetical protein